MSAEGQGRPFRASPAKLSMYRPLDFVMVRAPLLPIERYLQLSQDETDEWVSWLEGDPLASRALVVSSLSLARAMGRSATGERDRKRLHSRLLRYLIRMTVRPTPFGLCAGAALGHWAAKTELTLSESAHDLRSRLDMVLLQDFVGNLEKQPGIWRTLAVVAHPAITHRRGRIHLTGVETQRGARQTTSVSLRATGAVRAAVKAARNPVSYGQLATTLLQSMPGATPSKVDGLLEELRRHGFLISDLKPPLTASEPARHVVSRLAAIPAAREISASLDGLLQRLRAWDVAPPSDAAAKFVSLCEEVCRVTQIESKTPLQVDMSWPLGHAGIHRAVGQEAARAAELLLRLTPFPQGLSSIASYREAFTARYGTSRDVPLLELLDSESGLGPLRDGPELIGGNDAGRTKALMQIATESLHSGRTVVELDEQLLAKLQTWEPAEENAPLSMDLYVLVAAASAQAIDAGDFQLVVGPNVGATAAGRNLGRFADLLGPQCVEALRSVAQHEEALEPDSIFAELTFSPQGTRTANVVLRPLVRQHHVGLRPSAVGEGARFIAPDELYVRVRGARLALIWASPDGPREIRVCAGHMLNHKRAPAICRFLAEVGRDGVAQLNGFEWGAARNFPFLPRIQAGRSVLSLMRWRIDPSEMDHGWDEPADFADRLSGWRAHWRVPRHVFMRVSSEASDHRLLIDLENPVQAEELRQNVRRLAVGSDLCLEEAIPALSEAWLRGPGGRYAAELVVSLIRKGAAAPSEPVRQVSAAVPKLVRARPPGSDWTYIKLYCDPGMEDALIAGPLRGFARKAVSRHWAIDWSFLRYSDPEPHIRFRLRADPGHPTRDLIAALCTWATALMAKDVLTRFALDTYEREIERYGGVKGIGIAEQLFAIDSKYAAELLHIEQEGKLPIDRIALGVLSLHNLLCSLGLGERECAQFFDLYEESSRQAAEEYRRRKSELYSLLRSPIKACVVSVVRSALLRRNREIALISSTLRDLIGQNAITRDIVALTASYLHLHCNRLIGLDRAEEQKALGLLIRTRRSLEHRAT